MKSNRLRILLVVGARPNFIKIAPILRALKKYPKKFEPILVHTGQHYDFQMSEVFFQDLDIPKPDIFLGAGGGSHAEQTAKMLTAFEKIMLEQKPGMVLVVGDVNSTLAASLAASKLGIKIAHVEAGLRSFDRTMPEEVNRIVTDALSDLLFVTEKSGLKNLKKEGVPAKKIHFVGNVMIDSLVYHMKAIDRSLILKALHLKPREYCVLTLHRPSNVDTREALGEIVEILEDISKKVAIVYPTHPRTRKNLEALGLMPRVQAIQNLHMTEPLGYPDFLKLVKNAWFVATDSGGIQEETTYLKVPCLTLRENTERPVTVTLGTNRIIGRSLKKLSVEVRSVLSKKRRKGIVPPKWDGRAAERIIGAMRRAYA